VSTAPQEVVGPKILLVVGGGIAAYKSCELVRLIRKGGGDVTCVVTKGGQQFVTPMSLAALSENQVYTTLWDLKNEAEMGHIQLSREADLIVVCPATADLMAKMAAGLANDLASTLLMATDTPVMIVPAMNVRMWSHPATQRNLATLKADGIQVIGPAEGPMACGEFGPGRLAEVPDIVTAVTATFGARALGGKHVLVTSGPTHEPIDPVRYIANRSSGAQGTAIAQALMGLGARVTFVTGPASVAPPQGANVIHVETADQMRAAVEAAPHAEAAIFAAAVADWRVENASDQKMKKDATGKAPALQFTQNPDILAMVSAWPAQKRPALVVGFAAETEDVISHATAKRARKGCDWILANDVRPETGIMGGTDNAITLITAKGAEPWPRMTKEDTARKLAARIAEALA